MEITHEQLISLGFTEMPGRKLRYKYKGVGARLNPELGTLHIYGLSTKLTLIEDVKFIMMLIDYNPNASPLPFQANYN